MFELTVVFVVVLFICGILASRIEKLERQVKHLEGQLWEENVPVEVTLKEV